MRTMRDGSGAAGALRDETGMVGKIIVVWLLIVGLLGVAALDAGSILFTRFKLSDAAQTASVAAASAYDNHRDADAACRTARAAIPDDEDLQVPKNFCKVNANTGEVTVVLKTQADTIVAGRLGVTRDLTMIEIEESGRPSSL